MSFELSIMIKTTVILACACLIVALLRRASSATRHALWVIALFNALILPVGSALLPTLSIPVLQETTTLPAVQNPALSASVPIVAATNRAQSRIQVPISLSKPSTSKAASQWTFQRAVTTVWGLGFLFVFIRLILATWFVRRLARNSTILTDSQWNGLCRQIQLEFGISSTVQLRMAGRMPPMTWGLFRHVILLPDAAAFWPEERRRVVLAHELAHVKRHDGILQILVQVVCGVYSFSPMVWYAAHRLRIERERACDDHVLNLGTKADVYADHLLQIAKGIRPGPSFATVSMADHSQLETRLISILDSRTKRRRLSRMTLISLLTAIGMMTASIAAIRVTALAAMALPSFETPLSAPAGLGMVVAAPPQEQVVEPASLEGTVVKLGTAEPLPRVRVILNPASGDGNPLTVATDNAGRFAMQNIAPGRYQLLASRDGYVRTAYGQRIPNGGGAIITLAPRQKLASVALTMTPTGAISGKVRNQLGEAVANAAVQAQRYAYAAGREGLTLVETVRANDLGEYRLYYLDPGQYLISALPPTGVRILSGENSPTGAVFQTGSVEVLPGNQFSRGPGASTAGRSGIFTTLDGLAAMGFVSSANTGETYLPVFFPGVTNPAAATPILVKSGETFGAVDFTVSAVRALRIRGQVTNGATGQPLRGVSIVLMAQGVGTPGIPRDQYGTVSDTGAFEFRGIAPGSYELIASTGALPRGIPSIEDGYAGGAIIQRDAVRIAPLNSNTPRLAGRLSLQIGNGDVDNITLPLQPGFALNGKITVEGRSPADSAALTTGLVILLQPDPPDIVPEDHPSERVRTVASPASVSPDGTFSITNVFPGTYQIGIFNAAKFPQSAYVKSATFGEKDVLNPRLVIDSAPRSVLELVIATNPGSFSAAVFDDKQSPAAAATVVLIPDAGRRQHFDLYRFAISDDSGRAQIDGLAPGDYTAFATEDPQGGAWWDLEFLKKYDGLGKTIHINEGGKHTLDLKSIPIR